MAQMGVSFRTTSTKTAASVLHFSICLVEHLSNMHKLGLVLTAFCIVLWGQTESVIDSNWTNVAARSPRTSSHHFEATDGTPSLLQPSSSNTDTNASMTQQFPRLNDAGMIGFDRNNYENENRVGISSPWSLADHALFLTRMLSRQDIRPKSEFKRLGLHEGPMDDHKLASWLKHLSLYERWYPASLDYSAALKLLMRDGTQTDAAERLLSLRHLRRLDSVISIMHKKLVESYPPTSGVMLTIWQALEVSPRKLFHMLRLNEAESLTTSWSSTIQWLWYTEILRRRNLINAISIEETAELLLEFRINKGEIDYFLLRVALEPGLKELVINLRKTCQRMIKAQYRITNKYERVIMPRIAEK